MIYPLIGARIHGWLDDLVVLVYLMGSYFIGIVGKPLGIVLGAAVVHFLLTRLTRYPQGILQLLPFRVHAFVELAEGIAVLTLTWTTVPADAPGHALAFLTVMGLSQVAAFALTDYRWPLPAEKLRA